MGLFDRIRKKSATETSGEKPTDKTQPTSAGNVQADRVGANLVVTEAGYRWLLTPHVSEKAASLASHGTYVFNVPLQANKIEVRKAVEGLYKVKVEAVRMIRGKGKIVTRGRIHGQRNNWKKALVTLKSGQKIDLYEGV